MSQIAPGTPAVFLHAYPLDSRQWEGVAQRITGRRVLTPDFPGFGAAPPAGESLDEFAEAVIREMDGAGIDRAAIVGLSMGGYVAFRMFDRWPERIAALVLADTRAGADSEEARARRTAQADRARSEGIGWLADVMVNDALGETTRERSPEVVAKVRRIIEGADPEGVARALVAMRERPDSRTLLPRISVPVLVIVGREDRLTPIEEARAIVSAVPDGELVEIPGAGHYSNLENEDAFVAALNRFLEEGTDGP